MFFILVSASSFNFEKAQLSTPESSTKPTSERLLGPNVSLGFSDHSVASFGAAGLRNKLLIGGIVFYTFSLFLVWSRGGTILARPRHLDGRTASKRHRSRSRFALSHFYRSTQKPAFFLNKHWSNFHIFCIRLVSSPGLSISGFGSHLKSDPFTLPGRYNYLIFKIQRKLDIHYACF